MLVFCNFIDYNLCVVQDIAIYGVVNGKVYQAAVSEETSKHQISWQLEHDQSGAQIFNVMIYDEDSFAAYRKVRFSPFLKIIFKSFSKSSVDLFVHGDSCMTSRVGGGVVKAISSVTVIFGVESSKYSRRLIHIHKIFFQG